MALLPVAEAIEQLRAAASTACAVESVPLAAALDRVLGESVVSAVHVPPADNSAMDGYALRHADWPGPEQAMPVALRIAAGSVPGTLPPGTAARIFTGAELPAGADTVVMQEHTRGGDGTVVLEQLPASGGNVRPQGQDIAAGQEVLAPGVLLRPQELGLLASIGLSSVPVRRRLRVAIISNGDELIEPGEALAPGQIYNSNRYLLQGLMARWGFEVLDHGIASDDPARIEQVFAAAAATADVLISTGGVSVGEEDHVKGVVERLGELALWKIAMKPGKPLAFGRVADTPFIGLPGNPASALVTALVIARPFLFDLQGRSGALVEPLPMPAAFRKAGSPRQEYLRVRREDGQLQRYHNQSSGVLLSACWGDGLAVQAPGQQVEPGEPLGWLPYDRLY